MTDAHDSDDELLKLSDELPGEIKAETKTTLQPCCCPVVANRFMLRAPNASDATQLAALANNPNVASQTSNMPHPYGATEAEEWIASANEKRADRCAYVIVLKCDPNNVEGEIIGACSYGKPSAGYEGFEIGYWLGEPYWGHGHAAEACHALIDHIFTKTLAQSVWVTCRVTNARSRRVIEKCGFQYRENAMVRSVALGGMQPVERYVLDRGNWTSLKAWGREDV
ncbi:MAG: GNAT family N-acetyltransferase [Hyphomicrobiales bacterium]